MTNSDQIMERIAAEDAFERAIAAGRLSADPKSPKYAGQYMFMGLNKGRDLFKHICTREYLP